MAKGKKRWHPVSELFENCVRDSGSIVITCELCGRTHFSDEDAGTFEEGEYEALVEKAKKNPDKYIGPSGDMVSWGTIDGKQAVIGCPCNGLARYEEFIWRNQYVIAEYLKRRAKERLEAAQQDVDLVAGIPELQGGNE